MRSLTVIAVTGVGFFCCFAFAQENAGEGHVVQSDSLVYPMTYRLQDLPVWSSGGDYDPSVVIKLIESTIAPKQWNGPSMMVPNTQDASLVVSTTSANHRALADLIEQLRMSKTGPFERDCGSCGQTKKSMWR